MSPIFLVWIVAVIAWSVVGYSLFMKHAPDECPESLRKTLAWFFFGGPAVWALMIVCIIEMVEESNGPD